MFGIEGARMGVCLARVLFVFPFPLKPQSRCSWTSCCFRTGAQPETDRGCWVGRTAKPVCVLQEKPDSFLRGCFSEMEREASPAPTAPARSLGCCYSAGTALWQPGLSRGAVKLCWECARTVAGDCCPSRKWSPTSSRKWAADLPHLLKKKNNPIPASSVPGKLDGWGELAKGREQRGK